MNEIKFSDILLYTLAIVGVLSGVFILFLLYIKKVSEKTLKERYDFDKKVIELEYIRKNLEEKVLEANKKLEENEKRWKDINHLIITTENKLEENKFLDNKVIPSEFLKNFSINTPKDFEVDNRLVFYLTPFNESYYESFETVKNVCNNLDLKCIRGDEEFLPNDIFSNILRQIIKARFIIANISGRNPNVLYELGIAHALGKPVIIISQNFAEVPFDLGNKRIIIFEDNIDLANKLTSSIKDLFLNKII